MARPVDLARQSEILDGAVDHVIANGIQGLSWRPLACALGVSTATLVHHLGSKEQMLESILNRLRQRIVAETVAQVPVGGGLTVAADTVWRWSKDPAHEPMFRTFFAVYGMALQHPDLYSGFLDRVVADWRAAFESATADPDPVAVTILIAGIRGLLLDLLTTGDRERLDKAYRELVHSVVTVE